MPGKRISIWFFIGTLLLVYGILITSSGIWEWFNPSATRVVLAGLHAPVWWGGLLTVLGYIYTVKFLPGREKQ